MASIAPRRASYQLQTERRSSLSGVVRDEKHTKGQDQQQSSPLVKPNKSDDNNNQEEEGSTEDAACATPHGDNAIRPASPAASVSAIEKNSRHLYPAVSHDPPLITARLRQENAALKLQLVELENQHEIEVQTLKRQFHDAESTHNEVVDKLQKQISELEKRHREGAGNAHKYQAQLESLQSMVQRLEAQSKGIAMASRPPVISPQPQPPLAKQSLLPNIYPPRSENGSPFRYNDVQSLAWCRPSGQRPTKSEPSGTRYTPKSTSTCQPVASVIPVLQQDVESNNASEPTIQSILPLPVVAATEVQLRRAVVASGQLFSYCAEVITSKVATLSHPAGVKPNMKVMPTPSQHGDQLVATTGSLCVPVPRIDASPEDYTAITIL